MSFDASRSLASSIRPRGLRRRGIETANQTLAKGFLIELGPLGVRRPPPGVSKTLEHGFALGRGDGRTVRRAIKTEFSFPELQREVEIGSRSRILLSRIQSLDREAIG